MNHAPSGREAREDGSSSDRPLGAPRGPTPGVIGTASAVSAEEAALFGRLGTDDRGEVLVDLYERYGYRLYGLGLRLLGDRGMAEELVQDTFVRLWRSAGRFDPERGSARTFIYTLAHRAAIDLQRRTAARPLRAPRDESAGEPAMIELDEDPFERLLSGLELREALDALSTKHREVLELHFLEDVSQKEIADRLGVPLGTVKTRAHYALRALRLEMEERELVG